MPPTHAIYPSLQDKTVLISGGAEGIGAATVELFARQGSKVIFLDINEESARRTVAASSSSPSNGNNERNYYTPPIHPPIFYHCDLTNLTQLQQVTTEILSTHGPVHCLVNNAATTGSKSRQTTSSITPSDWEHNMNANLRHVFFLTQAVLPGMKAQHAGSIVNMGSITWRIPAGDTPVYGACKAAIMGLTRTQSKELGPLGVRVNSVMPGAIATERQVREVLSDAYRAEVFRNQSLQRDLLPVDVARVVVFLSSDEASAVTGSSYVVDGGWVGDP